MINLNIDLGPLMDLNNDLKPKIDKALKDAAQSLATQTHAHILEQVQQRLHSTREKYVDALGFKQVNETTWIINLEQSMMWIEEGMPEHEMLANLLKSPKAKMAKDGCVLNPRNKVLTSLGWKAIKNVVAGDMVLTHSGKFREVKSVLVQPAGVGTEYVSFSPVSTNRSKNTPKGDLKAPSISLTSDHLVFTPKGWVAAGTLKKGDLVGVPGDRQNGCRFCGLPVPINATDSVYCLNNSCKRKDSYRLGTGGLAQIGATDRLNNSKAGNQAAKNAGVFEREDWGARDPHTLHKMRQASAAAMSRRISDGQWAPEAALEEALVAAGLQNGKDFVREHPIVTDRWVNAGKGRQRRSTVFFDFFFPALNLAIELDGAHWHSRPEAKERDIAKNEAAKRDGIRLERIPSHKIYRRAKRLAHHLLLWTKNHSGDLGVAWVKIERVRKGVVNRPDHVFSKKYDLCLDAEEHSFCCETVFIHNSKYLVVPFAHKKGPMSQTPAAQDLTSTIKRELKQRNIPYGKIERGPDGKAKTGLLHSFDINKEPVKTHDGAGQGHGPVGAVRQGTTGIPFLQGIRIYQRNQGGKINRGIMTFRVASSKQRGSGKWVHPGLTARHFFEEGQDWALAQWDKISDQILKDFAL